MTKRCNRCEAVKPIEEFYGDRTAGDGLQRRCKDCSKAHAKEWHEKNPPDLDRQRETLRRFRERNPDKDKEYGRKWRGKDPERALRLAQARNRRYRDAKPERHVASQMRRRSRLVQITSEDTDYMGILRHDPCSYCGSDGGTIDHIEALHFGGETRWSNLTGACRRCNTSKGTGGLLSFLLRAVSA
jgi:5-methylcytosine-specific restriction endonuclease McrA